MIRIWTLVLLGCATGITLSTAYIESRVVSSQNNVHSYELVAFSGQVIAHDTENKRIVVRGSSTFFDTPNVEVAFSYNKKTLWIKEVALKKNSYLLGIRYEEASQSDLRIGDRVWVNRSDSLDSFVESITISEEEGV